MIYVMITLLLTLLFNTAIPTRNLSQRSRGLVHFPLTLREENFLLGPCLSREDPCLHLGTGLLTCMQTQSPGRCLHDTPRRRCDPHPGRHSVWQPQVGGQRPGSSCSLCTWMAHVPVDRGDILEQQSDTWIVLEGGELVTKGNDYFPVRLTC